MPALAWDAIQGHLQLWRDDGTVTPIHPLWLRERCSNGESRDGLTGQRLYNPSDLLPDQPIVAVRQAAGGFHLRFADGASGYFSLADILMELPAMADTGLPAPLAWEAATPAPAAFDWRDAGQPASRRLMLEAFLRDGYIVLSHIPSTDGEVLRVGRAFGFPRETNFGALFDVRSVPGARDLAYTSLPLDPHTDNPYRHPVPGIQLLHCLVNETEGGLSTLVDGLAVTEALRAVDRAAYDCLCRTVVRFRYSDTHADLVAHAPIILCDAHGTLSALHYSPRLDFVPLLPLNALETFYAARRRLDAMLRSPRFERRFRLAAGQLMMFDNCRLLHGRTGFDPGSGLRHLQGCYIDADGPRSQYRVLAQNNARALA